MQKLVDLFLETLVKTSSKVNKKGKAKFGSAKVTIKMSDDFDAPLDAFKDYTI